MDEYTADAFANREEPLPLLTVTLDDVDGSSSESERLGKRQRLRRAFAASGLKEKVQDHAEKMSSRGDGLSIQDRLFAKILQQVIPAEDADSEGDAVVDRRSSKYVLRPAFSLPLMTNNFRRFNARIGIVFVFQNRLIRLFTWKRTTHTLSFLAVFTFVCLDPYLLVVLPLATALLFVMVPAFIARHPPPPPSASTSLTTPYSEYTYSGPALAPPSTIRPAAETSKDFFRNMRDLQNSMADFSNLHDVLISLIAPATNFSNEIQSSTLFLYLSIATTALFVCANLFPWRFICLAGGYAMTISGHPNAQTWLVRMQKRAEKQAAKMLQTSPPAMPSDPTATRSTVTTSPQSQPSFLGLTPAHVTSTLHSLSQMTLDSPPETREVEIFELQHRPLQTTSSSAKDTPVVEWTHHLFTPSPYDPLSPARIAGERPRGTRFFEDVRPPQGWAWRDKKWLLDLEAGEWVQERLVVGVEYDGYNALDEKHDSAGPDAREGNGIGEFGGWVWDLPPQYGGTRDEEVWLAYGDYDMPHTPARDEKKDKGHKKNTPSRDWEEMTRWDTRGRTGEWRRRRWVRVVQRVGLGRGGSGGSSGDEGGGKVKR